LAQEIMPQPNSIAPEENPLHAQHPNKVPRKNDPDDNRIELNSSGFERFSQAGWGTDW